MYALVPGPRKENGPRRQSPIPRRPAHLSPDRPCPPRLDEPKSDFLANIVRLYRDEDLDFTLGGDEAKAKLKEIFSPSPASAEEARGEGKLKYRDVPGLCKAATLNEVETQGWSLNPGRYVGVAPGEAVSDEDFKEQLEALNEELEKLNAQARELEETIARNVAEILET